MDPRQELARAVSRRVFLRRSGMGIGGLALASLLNGDLSPLARASGSGRLRAKRVIFLFMFGGPSHVELFDPKPKLKELQGKELPASVRGNERFSANTQRQDRLLLVGSPFGFRRHGKAGVELSELLPHTGTIVDDLALVRSARTDSINH